MVRRAQGNEWLFFDLAELSENCLEIPMIPTMQPVRPRKTMDARMVYQRACGVAPVRVRCRGEASCHRADPGASTMTRAPIVITDEEAERRCLGGNTYRTHGIDARFASDREVAGLSARVPLKVCARRSIQGFWAHNQELGDTSLSVPLRIRPRPIFRGIA